MTRIIMAFGTICALTACGVDGEPSSPLAVSKSDVSLERPIAIGLLKY